MASRSYPVMFRRLLYHFLYFRLRGAVKRKIQIGSIRTPKESARREGIAVSDYSQVGSGLYVCINFSGIPDLRQTGKR